MLKYRIRATNADNGTRLVIDADTRDFLMWERTGKGRSAAEFGRNPTMEWCYSLAFTAGRRTGQVDFPLAEFQSDWCLDPLEEIDDELEADGEGGPTQSGR